MAEFPPEIIYDILSRMPIKSLARFRCVCKSWFNYINDPYLETIHVKEEPTPIMFPRFLPVDPNNNKLQCKITFLNLRVIQGTNWTVKKEPVLKICRDSSFFDPQNLVLGSCNGLTLFSYNRYPSYDGAIFFAVINPLTKQYHDLPPINHPITGFESPTAGIGFDESTNTLKTVCVILEDQISSLDIINVTRKQLRTRVHYSGMRTWREIAQIPAYPITGEGVFAHGRLHWLASRIKYWSPRDGRKIVWFDVKTEEFGLIDTPTPKGCSWSHHDQVVDLNGEVGFAFFTWNLNRLVIELWILKKEEWVFHCCFDLYQAPYNVVVSGCLNKNGDILFTTCDGRHLFVYTLKTGDLREVNRGDRCEANIRMYQSNLFLMHHINTSEKKMIV
ncbi:hypothetical protein L1987_33818 [Smallanthus sonchifolius]|uniref:Uncharacterized protein n=1 Tax=Smallanthus sonchifolius TaxID=185202 RepID=A0ACB9HTA7_9ASTR|nr:hypothetical protein L1987_33818 [Smallanthus sonchifolius]